MHGGTGVGRECRASNLAYNQERIDERRQWYLLRHRGWLIGATKQASSFKLERFRAKGHRDGDDMVETATKMVVLSKLSNTRVNGRGSANVYPIRAIRSARRVSTRVFV